MSRATRGSPDKRAGKMGGFQAEARGIAGVEDLIRPQDVDEPTRGPAFSNQALRALPSREAIPEALFAPVWGMLLPALGLRFPRSLSAAAGPLVLAPAVRRTASGALGLP